MDRRKFWSAIAVLVLISVPLFGGAESSKAQTRFVWGQVTGASRSANVEDVYMLDPHLAYAVGGDGNQGIAYRLEWNGTKWGVALDQRFSTWLKAVVAVADNNVWAVGDAGLIAHKTAGGWRTEPGVPSLAYFTTLQMLGDGEEGWAGGVLRRSNSGSEGDPLMMHYRNGQWQRDTSASFSGGISSLHFTEGSGYAVGANIWHYQSGQWTRENPPPACPDIQCSGFFNAVRTISGSEAWFVGQRSANCKGCKSTPYVIHKVLGGWTRSLPEQGLTNWKPDARYNYNLKGLAFYGSNYALAVGVSLEDAAHPLVLTYRDGRWSKDNIPVAYGDLNSVSLRDESHALAVGYNGLILSWGYGGPQPAPQPTATKTPAPPAATPTPGSTANPVTRVADPGDPNVSYFALVGHTLRGGFRDYWEQHGGLEQFGYPTTEEFIEVSPTNGKAYITQYFERARFEFHPENRAPYDVLLGLLGRTVTQGREGEAAFQPAAPTQTSGSIYFTATRHNMAQQFAGYWLAHGGLAVYGYPISEALIENSPTDGRPYLVQYFERNRLEYHPEMPAAFRVSLGLLGVQVLQERGWIR